MTREEFTDLMEGLEDGSDSDSELFIAICLLFHRIQLDDICRLQISDVYDAVFDVRSQIRKLKFAIPTELNYGLENYSNYLDENYECRHMLKLLPSYSDPIRLAEHIEDYVAAPEDILILGRQCYAEHLGNFKMPVPLRICKL